MGSGGLTAGPSGPAPGQQQCAHPVSGPGMQLPAGQAPNALNGRPTGQFRYVKNAADQSAVGGSAASTMNSFAEELKVENSSLSKNLKQNRDYGKVEANK